MANDFLQDANEFGAIKTETTYGVDAFGGAAPTAWTRFRKIDIRQVIDLLTEDAATASDTPERGVSVPKQAKVTWEVPLFPCNAERDEHELAAFFRMGKFKQTIDAGVDIRYAPHSGNDMTNTPSATFVKYELSEDGQVKKLLARGARSPFSVTLEQGSLAYMGGEADALYSEELTAFSAAPALPTAYSSDLTGMAVTNLALLNNAGSVLYKIEKAELKSNYSVTLVNGGEATGGGVVSNVLLHKPRSGAPATLDILLAGGSAAVNDLIGRMKSGEPIDFAASLSYGSRSLELQFAAGQIKGYSKQGAGLKKFQATLNIVRAAGSSGEGTPLFLFS